MISNNSKSSADPNVDEYIFSWVTATLRAEGCMDSPTLIGSVEGGAKQRRDERRELSEIAASDESESVRGLRSITACMAFRWWLKMYA